MKESGLFLYQYVSNYLKETSEQQANSKTTPIHYHVHDGTEIRNVKSFLSHIKTKAELKKPTEKLIQYYHHQGKPQKV